MQTYDIFANAAKEQAIKIILSNDDSKPDLALSTEAELVRHIVAKVLAKAGHN